LRIGRLGIPWSLVLGHGTVRLSRAALFLANHSGFQSLVFGLAPSVSKHRKHSSRTNRDMGNNLDSGDG